MKKMLTLACAIILGFFATEAVNAQAAQRNCSAMDVLNQQLEQNPAMIENMQRIEEHTNEVLNKNEENRINGVISIPVVVHVIYRTSSENISEAQIQSQIDVLNKDFRRTNSDADNTWSQAVDSEIEFCMATVDPNGNATTGITRKSSNKTSWGTNDAMKSSAQGGVDAWPADQYLNMWVCNIGNSILGYAQFPGGSASTDGVVMSPQYFGTTGYVSAPFNLGRTATHEVGHWLNLRHIWGDGACGADDFVSDTPASDAANYGCATGHTSCSSVDMVQNYMDYSDDACMNLFTTGQKARMRALFDTGGFRASLVNSNACGSAGPVASCTDGIQNGSETGVDCGGSCNPCPCAGTTVTLSLTLDNYPAETSWSLTNASGATVASGSGYSTANSTVSESFCLADGCYDFTINDSYGDGICCGYGNGSYSVTDASGASLVSGASFTSSETKNFCLGGGGTPTPTCTDGVQNGTETGVDCGGSCAPCASCTDGVQNGGETGVDCGGSCAPCPTCTDGVQNGSETGVDCGGSCAACPTCTDGIQNGSETGVDCGGSCAPCGGTGGGGCTTTTVDSNNFDSGWGIWNDGGGDCRRSATDAAYANSGSYCIRLRDNSGGASSMTTDNLALAAFEEVTIEFSYYAVSMDNSNEDFWLQASVDGGASYITLTTWARGVDFDNDQRKFDAVTITGGFSNTTRFRFRCDASANNDRVYIDDVVITGCSAGVAPSDSNPDTNETIADTGRGAADVTNEINLNVYPNPATNVVNVEYNTVAANGVVVRVFDVTGRPIMEMKDANESNKLQINVSDFAKGYYFIQIDNGKEQMIQKVIVM